MKNDGGPAFPLQTTVASGKGGTITLDERFQMQHGMTLRDYFVAKAMQAILLNAGGAGINLEPSQLSSLSFSIADAMLAERDK